MGRRWLTRKGNYIFKIIIIIIIIIFAYMES